MSSPCGKCYIGLTTTPLSWRISNIKSEYSKYKAGDKSISKSPVFEIIDKYGTQLTILEHVEADSRKELNRRAGWWIRNTPNAINRVIPGRTDKEWYADNRQTIKVRDALKYKENKEAILDRIKQYQSKKKADCQNGLCDVTGLVSKIIPEADLPEMEQPEPQPQQPRNTVLQKFFPVEFP